METTGREQIKTETEGEIRGTKDGADFLDEPKNLLERERVMLWWSTDSVG